MSPVSTKMGSDCDSSKKLSKKVTEFRRKSLAERVGPPLPKQKLQKKAKAMIAVPVPSKDSNNLLNVIENSESSDSDTEKRGDVEKRDKFPVHRPPLNESSSLVHETDEVEPTFITSKSNPVLEVKSKWEEVCLQIFEMMDRMEKLQKAIRSEVNSPDQHLKLIEDLGNLKLSCYELEVRRHRYCQLMDPSFSGPPPTPIREVEFMPESKKEKIRELDVRKLEEHIVKIAGQAVKKLEPRDTDAEIKWEQYFEYAQVQDYSLFHFCMLLKYCVANHYLAKPFLSMVLKDYFVDPKSKFEKSPEAFAALKNQYFYYFVEPGYQSRAMFRLFTLCYRVGEKTLDFSARVYKDLLEAGLDPKRQVSEENSVAMVIANFYHKYPVEVQTFMSSKGGKNEPSDFSSVDELLQLGNSFLSIPQVVKLPKVHCPQCHTVLVCKENECQKIAANSILPRLGSKVETPSAKIDKCSHCGKKGHNVNQCRKRSNDKIEPQGDAKRQRKNFGEKKKEEEKKNDSEKEEKSKKALKIEKKNKAKRKGLCYKCNEPYSPGHKCDGKAHLQLMVSEKATSSEESEMSDVTSIYGSEGMAFAYESDGEISESLCMVVHQPKASEFITMPALILGAKVLIGVDSMATLSYMTPEFAKDRGIEILPSKGKVILGMKGVEGQRKGRTVPVPVQIEGRPIVNHVFEIWDLPQVGVNVILGLDGFKTFGITVSGIPVSFPSQDEATKA